MLSVNNIEVVYSSVILVLKGVSLAIDQGKIAALLGANGAGKSTALKAISGLLRTELGDVTHGNIEFNGLRIDNKSAQDIAAMGITQVIEGHRMFEQLTTEENLYVGAYLNKSSRESKRRLEQVYQYFPKLKDLRQNTSGYLSGGEQQMLAISRSLMSRPKLMLLDEPSLGLAPLLVSSIFEIIGKINKEENISILLVEQNARAALGIAEFAYVMENGRVVLDGPSKKLKANEDIREFYLGLTQVGNKKRYSEVKHYKRRKRWLA